MRWGGGSLHQTQLGRGGGTRHNTRNEPPLSRPLPHYPTIVPYTQISDVSAVMWPNGAAV